MTNLWRVNPVSCRFNHLLISYLVSKQARLNADFKRGLVQQYELRVNPVSCRINHLLISYLVSKQARLNADFKSGLVQQFELRLR